MNVAKNTQGKMGDAEAFGVGIGLFFWLVLWAVPMVVLGIIALVTRPKATAYAAPAQTLAAATLCQHCGKYYPGSARFCPLCGGQQ